MGSSWMRMEIVSGRSRSDSKKRSQFRVASKNIPVWYGTVETVVV